LGGDDEAVSEVVAEVEFGRGLEDFATSGLAVMRLGGPEGWCGGGGGGHGGGHGGVMVGE
jgi:hypothetical protein